MSKLGAHERILSTPALTIFLRCKKRGDGDGLTALTMTANAVQNPFEFIADDRVLSLPESLSRQSPMSGEEAGRASSMFCAHAVLGWQCVRADQIFHARDVMTTVWEEIMRADLIVADLTGQNANVFYELGFAHALNKDTILLTQTGLDEGSQVVVGNFSHTWTWILLYRNSGAKARPSARHPRCASLTRGSVQKEKTGRRQNLS